MLKLRIILTSALILLLVGLDMNVRAAVDSKKADAKSSEKDDSEKESEEKQSQEVITNLDFFGAFSLVNIQLQWRDLSSMLNNESTDAKFSSDPIKRSLQELQKRSLDGKGKILVPAHSFYTGSGVIPTSIFQPIDGKTHFIYTQNKQIKSTIAYIQNCSVYPHEA